MVIVFDMQLKAAKVVGEEGGGRKGVRGREEGMGTPN